MEGEIGLVSLIKSMIGLVAEAVKSLKEMQEKRHEKNTEAYSKITEDTIELNNKCKKLSVEEKFDDNDSAFEEWLEKELDKRRVIVSGTNEDANNADKGVVTMCMIDSDEKEINESDSKNMMVSIDEKCVNDTLELNSKIDSIEYVDEASTVGRCYQNVIDAEKNLDNHYEDRIGIGKNEHKTAEGRDSNGKDNLESGHGEDVDIAKDEIKNDSNEAFDV
ncbi:14989_t:CDS:2 [Dentiscutata erythropus]|uniref:14989_t:CDS:1 n=1 Tax=Dentiscutata erythropus TaxID=1348616 RepID=A0A9N9AWR2_9GLOM|nr:14989_t:CDS:2 [Dentiscutata erythropus]